jgi:hypothetical protein
MKHAKQTKEQRIPWSKEALKRVEDAPNFVRPGIYKLMEKRARERGIDFISSAFLTEIRNESMMLVSKRLKKFGVEGLTMEAFETSIERMKGSPRKVEVIGVISDFIGSKTTKNREIIKKFQDYMEVVSPTGLPWDKEALEKLSRVPEHIRGMAKKTIEEDGRKKGYKMVTQELFDLVFGQFQSSPKRADKLAELTRSSVPWTKEAQEKIGRIPLPFIRKLIIERTEKYAMTHNLKCIDPNTIEKAEG